MPSLRSDNCLSTGYALRLPTVVATPWGVAPNPTFATWQGCMAGGLRPTSCPLPPSVGRYGQHQGCGFARNAHPFGARAAPCAPRAASAFALDTVLRSKLFERKGGQVNRGIPQPHRGEDMPRKSLDALGVTPRLGMGAGRAKRSAAATCTPATWRTDKPPWGGASVGGCNE